MLFPSIKKFHVFVDFQSNRQAISAEFCENIQTDENCQGTCHLIKEIKKENSEKKNFPSSAIDNIKYELFFFTKDVKTGMSVLSTRLAFLVPFESDFSIPLDGVFHPPKKA